MIRSVPDGLSPLVLRVLSITKKYIITPFKAILSPFQRKKKNLFLLWISVFQPSEILPHPEDKMTRGGFGGYNALGDGGVGTNI